MLKLPSIISPAQVLPDAPVTTLSPDRPSFASYQYAFLMAGNQREFAAGLYYHGLRADGQGGFVPFDVWIGSFVAITAQVTDELQTNHGFLVDMMNGNGGITQTIVRKKDIANGGNKLLEQLFNLGFRLELSQKNRLFQYFSSAFHNKHVIASTRCGWLNDVFVLPSGTIGDDSVVYDQQSDLGGFSPKGALAGWSEATAVAAGNSAFILLLSYAFSGPLLRFFGISGGGFHIYGDSSAGKSVLSEFAASVFGAPEKLVKSWRISKVGCELYAHAANETLLVLDEIKNANPHDLGDLVYLLANGGGSVKATQKRTLAPMVTFRTPVISNGERSIGDFLALHKQQQHTGMAGRLIEIPVSNQYGVFDALHGYKDEHALSAFLRKTANASHGLAAIAFIEQLVKEKDIDSLVRVYLEATAERFKGATGIQKRASRLFSVAAFAGVLASRFGLIKVDENDIVDAIEKEFMKWVSTIAEHKSETSQIIESIESFVMANSNRFSEWHPNDDTPVINRAGWYKTLADGNDPYRIWLFTPDGLKEAAGGHAIDRIIEALKAVGIVQIAADGKAAKNTRVLGTQKKLYHIRFKDQTD